MASNVTRDHHNLRRNLNLNGNYISNDGGDEGITINDSGLVSISGDLNLGGGIDSGSGIKIDATTAIELDSGSGDVYITKGGVMSNLFAVFNADTKQYNQNYDINNYLTLAVGANGATTLSTTDSDGAVGHLTLAPDGSIILNSASGGFEMHGAGTTAKFADMYAGMLLGYTDIGLDEGHTTLALTTVASGYVIPTDEFSVAFVIPPSGNVLIEFQIQYGSGSSGLGTLHAGLSTTNKTTGYTQLADYHEKMFDDSSVRNGIYTVNGSWTLTGLTAGDSEELWIAFASASVTGSPTIYWGSNSSGRYPDFIMKATALPASITT